MKNIKFLIKLLLTAILLFFSVSQFTITSEHICRRNKLVIQNLDPSLRLDDFKTWYAENYSSELIDVGITSENGIVALNKRGKIQVFDENLKLQCEFFVGNSMWPVALKVEVDKIKVLVDVGASMSYVHKGVLEYALGGILLREQIDWHDLGLFDYWVEELYRIYGEDKRTDVRLSSISRFASNETYVALKNILAQYDVAQQESLINAIVSFIDRMDRENKFARPLNLDIKTALSYIPSLLLMTKDIVGGFERTLEVARHIAGFNVKWRFDERDAIEYFLKEGAKAVFEASEGQRQSELYLAYVNYLMDAVNVEIIEVSDYWERLFFHLMESDLEVLNVANLLLDEDTFQEGLSIMTDDVVIFLSYLLPEFSDETINKETIISEVADYLNKSDLSKNYREWKLRNAFAAMYFNENSMLRWKYGIYPASSSDTRVTFHFLWNGEVDTAEVRIPREELDKEGEVDSQIKEYLANIIYARGVTKGIEAIAISYEIPSYRTGVTKRDLAVEIKDFIADGFFNISGGNALTEFAYYVNFGRDVEFYSDIDQFGNSQSINMPLPGSFDPNRGVVVGIDIGGTNIETVLVEDGRISELENAELNTQDIKKGRKISEPVNKQGAAGLLAQIKSHIEDIIKSASGEIDAIGIIFPGPVYEGEVKRLTNFGNSWNEAETKKLNDGLKQIAADYGIKMIVENDANAGGFGVIVGDKKNSGNNQLVFGLGTGIGFTQVINGIVIPHPYEGGHIPIVLSNKEWECGCGAAGCLEAYAGKKGIVKSAVLKLAEDRGLEVETAEDLVKNALNGDAGALAVIGIWKGKNSFNIADLSSDLNTVFGDNFDNLAEQERIDRILGDYITPKDVGDMATDSNISSDLRDLALEVWQDIARYIAEAVVVSYDDLGQPDTIILTGGVARGETAIMLKNNVENILAELKVLFPEIGGVTVEVGDFNYWGAYGAAQYANLISQNP